MAPRATKIYRAVANNKLERGEEDRLAVREPDKVKRNTIRKAKRSKRK